MSERTRFLNEYYKSTRILLESARLSAKGTRIKRFSTKVLDFQKVLDYY